MDVIAVKKIRQSALSDIVGSDGQISPLKALAISGEQSPDDDSDSGPLYFRFDYDGILFESTLEKCADTWRLQVVGNCGPVPFSIESQELRQGLLAIVDDAKPVFGGTLTVQPNHRLQLQGEWTVTAPVSPGTLLAGPVNMLRSARPVLDRIAALFAAQMSASLKLAS